MTKKQQLNNSLIRTLATVLRTYDDVRNDGAELWLCHLGDECEVQRESDDTLITLITLRSDADVVQAIKDVCRAICEAL